MSRREPARSPSRGPPGSCGDRVRSRSGDDREGTGRGRLGDDRVRRRRRAALPYEDGSFDVVASAFGVIFAPEPAAAAAELARVCRPGGRLGLTTWVPDEDVAAIYEPFTGRSTFPPDSWGEANSLERVLGDLFGLEVERHTWWVTGRNGAEVWRLYSTSAPP